MNRVVGWCLKNKSVVVLATVILVAISSTPATRRDAEVAMSEEVVPTKRVVRQGGGSQALFTAGHWGRSSPTTARRWRAWVAAPASPLFPRAWRTRDARSDRR